MNLSQLRSAGNIPLNIDVETKKIGLELILGYVKLNSKLLAEIAELRKENAEIPELREKLLKFAEVEAENAKLKQIIEENARRDSENAELKSRVGELEARLALLEQGSAVDGMTLSFGQTQNDKEAMPVVTILATHIKWDGRIPYPIPSHIPSHLPKSHPNPTIPPISHIPYPIPYPK
ncbi:hypothetical protein GLOIN_2v1695309 [Rhizophagus irregularis DAOM 181602=DAOM 197198]|nr:hypothetical protein GLOIN_2v1695309 [Rhizophagus irregularis DAOM 181602=DAOM 197198]